ncbi:MAG: secondary thiamine-phosphate synthase enzyme YjbQ [Anaerolineae bacterium]
MVVTQEIQLSTAGNGEIHDITEAVAGAVRASGLANGTVTIFSPSSTSAITTLEYESGLLADMAAFFERAAATGLEYQHNLRWRDGNGHAHVRAALFGPSLSVPFIEGRLTLGTWQQIVFIDFDNRPRSRRLVVQLVGD